MTSIDIYRSGSPPLLQASVNIDERTVFQKSLMKDHAIVAETTSSTKLLVQVGDYIVYNSESYFLNRLPEINKTNNTSFKYSFRFEGSVYDLKKKLYISNDGLAQFSYNGTAEDLIDLIISNINSISSGWSKGIITATDSITLEFANESCHAALIRIAEQFNLEFDIAAKAITMFNAVGNVTAYSFAYGRGAGLYNLTRQQVNDQSIITRCFGFGSTRNIPYTYRSGAKRLVFETEGLRYLTKNTDLYGIIEGQFTDDNIFPQRTGTLTGVSYPAIAAWDTNTDYLTDSAMDFDLNDYLIEGQTATIVFKSGDNSGVECEIWNYDNTNKRFYITPFTDSTGYIQPNITNHPNIGDSYTLVNISMPQSYIDTAETALQVATQAYIDENSVPMVVYTVEIDPKYASGIGLVLDAGDKVTVVDTDLGINSLIRVSGIEFPLVNPYQIKAVIADFVPYTLQERIIKAAISTRKETVFVDRRQSELARRNTVNQKSLKDLLFDTDMYFDATNIKPLSIETAYLSVGARSSDFWLSNVTIKANYLGDANRLYVSNGSLVHLQIEIAGLGYTWVIGTPLDQAALTPASAYYLYARCSKSALTGSWILSTSQITVESEAGFYHFLTGMLFIVADGYRDFDFTYGMTYINGNTITTGKIQSIDTNNYFDLTQGKFKVGDANSQLDWNVTAANVLTLKGALVQTTAGTLPALTFVGAYSSGVTYQKGNQITYGGSSWNYINATPGSGHTPAEDAYWTKSATAGTNGTNGSTGPGINYRGIFSGVTNYFNNSLTRDVVKYGSTYYFYIGVDNQWYAWDEANWQSFGSSWSSVATQLLLAEYATIENLGVRYFEGVPVTEGFAQGAISIEGNDIFEGVLDDDNWGEVSINMKGFNGGITRRRRLYIGDGKGTRVVSIGGSTVGNSVFIYAAEITAQNIPTSGAGLTAGHIYRDGAGADAILKIK